MPKTALTDSANRFDLRDDQLVTESDNLALGKSLEELNSFDDKGPAKDPKK
jgi:hypothetical protein